MRALAPPNPSVLLHPPSHHSQFYDAGLAGLSVGLSPSLSGWQFSVGGWSSMSLPLFSSFFSALNVFTDSSATAAHKPGDDSVVRAVQVRVTCHVARVVWGRSRLHFVCVMIVLFHLTASPFLSLPGSQSGS